MSWSGCPNLHQPLVTSPLHQVITALDPSTYFADPDPGSPNDSAAGSAASSPSPPPAPSPVPQRPRLTIALKRPTKIEEGAVQDPTRKDDEGVAQASPEIAWPRSPEEKGEKGSLSPRDNDNGPLHSAEFPTLPPRLTSLALVALAAQAPSQPQQRPPNLDPALFPNSRSYNTTSPTPPQADRTEEAQHDVAPPAQDPANERPELPTTADSLANHHSSLQPPTTLKRKADELEEDPISNTIATSEEAHGDAGIAKPKGDELEEGEIKEDENDRDRIRSDEGFDGEGEDEYVPAPPPANPPTKRQKVRRSVEDSAGLWRTAVGNARYWNYVGEETAQEINEADAAGEAERADGGEQADGVSSADDAAVDG